jgi:type IV secretory pathway VirB10-like protein
MFLLNRCCCCVSIAVVEAAIEEFQMNTKPLIRSRVIIGLVILSGGFLARCTTSEKKTEESVKTPESVQKSESSTPAHAVDPNLPPELQDVEHFDPATTIDQKTVEQSEFYKAKKDAEASKAQVDAVWKIQDDQESLMRKKKEDEDRKRQEELKKEDLRKQESQRRAVDDHKRFAKERRLNEKRARSMVKKMPTISRDEMEWKGLE